MFQLEHYYYMQLGNSHVSSPYAGTKEEENVYRKYQLNKAMMEQHQHRRNRMRSMLSSLCIRAGTKLILLGKVLYEKKAIT